MDSDIINVQTIKISAEILNLITEIDEFKATWQFLGKISPGRLSSLQKVATIESIGSSTRIEGAKLSDREVEALLARIDTKSFQSRDEQEVSGYAKVCENIFLYFTHMPCTENVIKQMHIWLLEYSDKDARHKGEYKKIPIHIEAFDVQGISAGIVFETTSPFETPIKMRDLVDWMNLSLKDKLLHPLIVIGLFTAIFLAIHPFQDGNGRLSRLLTTFLMLKSGYQYVPYSSLESIIEQNKESYYLALQRTQKAWQNGKPDWEPWLRFFLHCLQRQKRHLEVKISREKILRAELNELSQQVLEFIQSHELLSINELTILTKANRNTLKKILSFLVQHNYILMIGKGRASKYTRSI